MSRSILAVVVRGLMLVTGPLLGQNVPEPAQSTELPEATLPSDLDRVLRHYERAWRAGDAVALASLFAKDGYNLSASPQHQRAPNTPSPSKP